MRIPIPALLVLSAMISGCMESSESPTALRRIDAGAALSEGAVSSVGAALVTPMQRTSPLAAPVSWSFTAGPGGVTSSNAATGLTIAIPAGALAAEVMVTVTAFAGNPVAYGFEPHGLVFAQNVWLAQSLSGIDAGLLSTLAPIGAHFEGDAPVYTDGLALVNEIVGAQLNLLGGSLSFPIGHFSGWIVASGRSDGDDSGQ